MGNVYRDPQLARDALGVLSAARLHKASAPDPQQRGEVEGGPDQLDPQLLQVGTELSHYPVCDIAK